MAHWIVKKYNNGNVIYVSGFDKDGSIIHTTDKEEAIRFDNIGVPMALYFEYGYCIEKQY